jgi:general secretion pathway protein K
MSARCRDESGIALLVVLLTITLLTIVVLEFTDYAQVETNQALSARNALQATYLARSGINVAEALVSYDGAISPGSDGEQDLWAKPYPPLPIGDGTAAIRMRDEARFLNLNEIISGTSFRQERFDVFKRLFTRLGIEERILWAIVDWMDQDGTPHVNPIGAEQASYLGLRPPVFVRNRPFLTFRELLLVRGVTPSILARLEPFVTVLPPAGELKVNVNTAPAMVLAVLSDGLSGAPGIVDRLVETRATEVFQSPKELYDSVTDLQGALGQYGTGFVTFNSTYFRLEAVGEIGDVRRGIVELVKRDGKKVTRVTWTPTSANLALTSLPPSDFLATLPILGDR